MVRSVFALYDSRCSRLIVNPLSSQYDRLGIQGASSLLGGLAYVLSPFPRRARELSLTLFASHSIVFIPIPFVLIKYGKKIRGMSKNAVVLD